MSWAQITFSRFAISVCKELGGGHHQGRGRAERPLEPPPTKGPRWLPRAETPWAGPGKLPNTTASKSRSPAPCTPCPKALGRI